jgi:hypothetical protein
MVISILVQQCWTHSSTYGRSGGYLQNLSKRYDSDSSGKRDDEILKAIFLPNLTRLAPTFYVGMYDY